MTTKTEYNNKHEEENAAHTETAYFHNDAKMIKKLKQALDTCFLWYSPIDISKHVIQVKLFFYLAPPCTIEHLSLIHI